MPGKKVMKLVLHVFIGHLPPISHQQERKEETHA